MKIFRLNSKLVLSLVLLGLLVALVSACGAKDKNLLVVGMELAYPPFETTDNSNRPAGFSVDLASELAAHLGKEVKIENMAWTGLIPALETGKVDLVISSMTITEERLKTINFSDPYAAIGLALLINSNSDVESYADLAQPGRVLAVKKGTSGHLYAAEHLPAENIMVFDKESACVLEVTQGKADAFTYDQLTILRQWQQNPDKTKVNLQAYQDSPEFWGIGISKKTNLDIDQINSFIADFRQQGGFDRLADRHLQEEKAAFKDLGIPFLFDIDGK